MDEVTRQAFFQELTLLEMQKEAWNPMPAVQGAWTAAKGLGQYAINNPGQAAAQAGGWLKKVTLDSAGQGFKRIGEFVSNPGQTLRTGWRNLTPINNPELLSKLPSGHHIGMSQNVFDAIKSYRLAANPGLQTHLQNTAESLSRRGWTGQGNLTKYLPVGAKGMLAVGAVPTAIGMAGVARGGSAEDAFGGAAGTVGAVAGTGLPFVGSTILGKTFEGAGRRLGTGVDWALHRGRFAPQRPVQPTGVGYNQQP